MSRPILDDLTRALFAHLRGGNACFDEENELIALFRRCPRCSRSLRPLILDTFTDDSDGQQYERMWWTCPGIGQKKCFFPLDMPKEVFWTRRSMAQSLRGVHPLPNLHLLPVSLHPLYPKLFKSKINIEQIVQLSSFVPSDGQKNAVRPANAGTEGQPLQGDVDQCAAGDVADPLPSTAPPPLLFSPHCRPFCDAVPSSSRHAKDEQTVHSFLKETLRDQMWPSKVSSVQREHRRVVDLSPNANVALSSNLLLRVNPERMITSLNSQTAPTDLNQPTVPRYLTQQQHVRLKGMLRRSTSKPKENGFAQSGHFSRYLLAPGGPLRAEMAKKKGGKRRLEQSKREKTKCEEEGHNKRNGALDVLGTLNTLENSMTANELMSRFYGRKMHLSSATFPKETNRSLPKPDDETADSGSEPFHAANVSLPQSPTIGRQSTTTVFTNSANSSESNGSSLGRVRRGLSIGPPFLGVSDSVEDPALAEKIARNYESIFLKTMTQMSNGRRSVTPSALSLHQMHPGSHRLDFFGSVEAGGPEEGTLGGIPHDFQFPTAQHSSVMASSFDSVAVHSLTQLTPINYAEGEDLSKRFAQNQVAEVVELSQQQQMSTLALDEMPDYDAFLGFGLEQEGDATELHMAPMMSAEEAEDERYFLRAQLGMFP